MNTSITIIWGGNVWKFVSEKLSGGYSVEKVSARKVGWVSGILANRYADKITRVFSDRETVRSLVEKLEKWERVLFTGKSGDLLDQMVRTIESECPNQKSNFYILWINGFQNYEGFPRLVLNHAIKEKQVKGKESPNPVVRSGKSCLYQPNPSKFDEELVKNLGFDVELTSDKNVFLKALYLKCCINTIYNSICISNGPYVKAAVNYFSQDAIDTYVSELYQSINHLSSGLLSEEEIQQEVHFMREQAQYLIPSSVGQFWTKLDGYDVADYENSDVSLLLEWVLRYTQQNSIHAPALLELMEEILWRWNRANGVHMGPDGRHLHMRDDGSKNRTWFAQPIAIGNGGHKECVWIDTGVR